MWGSGHFSLSWLDSVLLSNGNSPHNLLEIWILLSTFLRTISAVLRQ